MHVMGKQLDLLELEILRLTREVELLRYIVRRYGDKMRMGFAYDAETQAVIDRAIGENL